MREGFVRVINRSGEGGEVTVVAVDDAGWRGPVLTLAVAADETVHFNSNDLEQGNPDKGLSGGTGAPTQGDWRLELTSDLDLEVLAYIRTGDGFLTAMHDVVERGLAGRSLQPGSTTGHPSHEHRVAIFNPGRNKNQVSLVRLINPGAENAEVTITGIDDAGAASTGGETGAERLTLTAGAARTISAAELESAGERGKEASDGGVSDTGDPLPLTGELGPGTGKWQLLITSEQPVVAMSLLMSPTGHLTNLSSAPFRAIAGDNLVRQMAENTEAGVAIGDPVTALLGGGAELTHGLEGPDADSFDIDAPSGQLRTREGAARNWSSPTRSRQPIRTTTASASPPTPCASTAAASARTATAVTPC